MSYYGKHHVATIYCYFGRKMMIDKMFGGFPVEYKKLFELQIIPYEMIKTQVSHDEHSDREKINRQWSELFNTFGWTKKTIIIFKPHSSNYLANHPHDMFSVLTSRKKSKKDTLYTELCDVYGFEIKLRKW